MRYLKLGLAVFCLTLFSGCTTLAITGGGLGVGYLYSNVAHKTINYPIDRVDRAIVAASAKMDITIIDNSETEDGRTIKASTRDLDIVIDLESVTSKTTKISVNARDGIFIKDKATATAIITETEMILGTESGVKTVRGPWRT
ncbi:MAG: DUF3568 family protein [Nitrospinaceae bacterium]